MPKYNGPIRKPKAALGDGEKATAASAPIAAIVLIFRMVRHPKNSALNGRRDLNALRVRRFHGIEVWRGLTLPLVAQA
jgi:hypothetical protein